MGKMYRGGYEFGKNEFKGPAHFISFTPGNSGLTSTNVRNALFELWESIDASKLDNKFTELTVATNPTTNRNALKVTWYDHGSNTHYFDFTN